MIDKLSKIIHNLSIKLVSLIHLKNVNSNYSEIIIFKNPNYKQIYYFIDQISSFNSFINRNYHHFGENREKK